MTDSRDSNSERGDEQFPKPQSNMAEKVISHDFQARELGLAAADMHPSPWTKQMFCLYAVLFVAYLCSCLNGFDGSLMSSINAMPQYQTYFGMDGAGSSTGILFAMYNIGSVAAVLFTGPVNDYFGRRWGMFVGCFFVIVGTCIAAPTTTMAGFLGGRFVLGFGVAFCSVAAPSYVAELAHPYWRGPLSGLYNTCWYVGSIIAGWTTYATAFIPGNNAWRVPIWAQMITSGIVIIFVLFLPESPRWLMAHDKKEEAIRVLAKFHGNGDVDNYFVKLQIAEMEHQIRTEASDKSWWDYRELFNTRSARKRLICVAGMGWFGQYSGNAVSSYFFPVMLKIAGLTNPHMQLLLNALFPITSWVASIIGANLLDRVGRRPLLLYTIFFSSICFAILTGTTRAAVVDGNTIAGNATIAFVYIFGCVFSFGWTPLQALYISETLPTETRAKGTAFGQLVSSIASTVGQYAAAAAMGSIGYWYYLFFVFWDLIEWTVIYFFWPETKNRTLEEMNVIFAAKNPVKKSLEARDSKTVIMEAIEA